MAEATHTLISIIVNDGFADDAMAAARKAGAGGGTIINARGTGREDDAKFFGITIVPEKEMLLILAEKSKADAILDAVRSLPCLQTKGTGITYCIDVNDFAPLGTPRK
ncbi:MAG: P-II family nitrogen regulator [Spirochaetaceae bacterium]|nr:P-II family nitrogen regulator [Spirochaetaceae bacterium]